MSGSTDSGNSWQERLPPEHIHKTLRKTYDDHWKDHWITTLIPSEYLDDLLFPEKNNNIDYVWSYPVLFAEAFLRYWLFHGNKVAYEKLRWWQWVEKGEKIEGQDFEDLQSGRKFFHKELMPLRKKSGEMPLPRKENLLFTETLIEKIEAYRECHGIIPVIIGEEGLPLPFRIRETGKKEEASIWDYQVQNEILEWKGIWDQATEDYPDLKIEDGKAVELFWRSKDWMKDKEGKGFLEGESFLLPLLLAMRKNRGKTDFGSPLDLIATGNIETDLKRVVLGPKYEMATRLQSKFFICPKEGKIEKSEGGPEIVKLPSYRFLERLERRFPKEDPLKKKFDKLQEDENKQFECFEEGGARELVFQNAIRQDIQSSPLFLTGDPGAGKTALSCQIANRISTDFPETAVVPFFFRRAWGNTVDDLERFLMNRLTREFHDPPVEHLEDYLDSLGKTKLEGKQVVLILDGLDEGIEDKNDYDKLDKS